MRYFNTQTQRQTTEFIDEATTIIDSDERVSNWFAPLPEGFKRGFDVDDLPILIEYELDVNGNFYDFYLQTPDENGKYLKDAVKIQAEVDKQAIAVKWVAMDTFLSELTVQRPLEGEVPAGFKFSANPQSLANISLEIDTMLDKDTRKWREDWGNQEVTKQELQEAKRLASEAKQAKLTELFGA
jgi:hypothetical protein